MNLVKTSIYTSISTAITFISGFIVIKVVAVKIGPAGMAYVGQYQNTLSIFAMLSTCAILSGVVKYLAGYQHDKVKQQEVITTAITIIISFSLLATIIIIPLCFFLSKTVFHNYDFWWVYVLYGLFISTISLNAFFAAVLNGFKYIKNLTIINIISSVFNIIFTVGFAYKLGVKGVLIASNFVAIVIFFVNIYFIKKIDGITWFPSFKRWNKKMAKLLFAFTLMGLASGFTAPSMQFLVRDRIISKFSIIDAGCWQAVTRISDYYLAFITTVLSVYYLPRLSEISTKDELRKEIIKGYKIILPSVGILAFAIFLCKIWVVHLLFTPEFLPMVPLFKFQLLGDFLKIGSWLLGFIMISKALTKTFIITEILFSVSFVILSFILMDKFGLVGTTYAFCINYALYWLMMWFLMKKYIV